MPEVHSWFGGGGAGGGEISAGNAQGNLPSLACWNWKFLEKICKLRQEERWPGRGARENLAMVVGLEKSGWKLTKAFTPKLWVRVVELCGEQTVLRQDRGNHSSSSKSGSGDGIQSTIVNTQ